MSKKQSISVVAIIAIGAIAAIATFIATAPMAAVTVDAATAREAVAVAAHAERPLHSRGNEAPHQVKAVRMTVMRLGEDRNSCPFNTPAGVAYAKGWAKTGPDSPRPTICVADWSSNTAQTAIVLAHELGHVVDLTLRHHKSDIHDHQHYTLTGRMLDAVLTASDAGPLTRARVKAYYAVGTLASPFSDTF